MRASISLFILIIVFALLVAFLFVNIADVKHDVLSKSITLEPNQAYELKIPEGTYYVHVKASSPIVFRFSSCSYSNTKVVSNVCNGSKLLIQNKNDNPNSITLSLSTNIKLINHIVGYDYDLSEKYYYIEQPVSCKKNSDCNFDQSCVNGICMSKDKGLCDDNYDCKKNYVCLNNKCIPESQLKLCGDSHCSNNENYTNCPYDCAGFKHQGNTFYYYVPYGSFYKVYSLNLSKELYEKYKTKERTFVGFIYAGNNTYLDISDYICMDCPYLMPLIDQLNHTKDPLEYTIRFVQSISYKKDISMGYDEYPKYPIETLYEGDGDCEDSSILLASILESLGYDVLLVYYPGHVAIAVKDNGSFEGTYYSYKGKKYYYVETTSMGWKIGEIPDEYLGEDAIVVPIEKKNGHISLDSFSCSNSYCLLKGESDKGRVVAGFNINNDSEQLYNYNSVYSAGNWSLVLYFPKSNTYRIVVWLEQDGRKVAGPIYTKWQAVSNN